MPRYRILEHKFRGHQGVVLTYYTIQSKEHWYSGWRVETKYDNGFDTANTFNTFMQAREYVDALKKEYERTSKEHTYPVKIFKIKSDE